jgi:hypothetical protein
MTPLSRPAAAEYGPGIAGYIDEVGPDEDALLVLDRQLQELPSRLGSVSPERAEYRYAPGKWTIKDIVVHLSDSERVFAYRALRVARGDTVNLAGFDEAPWIVTAEAGARTLGDAIEEWRDIRQATLSLFRHLPAAAWTRVGRANDQPASARALAYTIAGHTEHHLEVIQARYLK